MCLRSYRRLDSRHGRQGRRSQRWFIYFIRFMVAVFGILILVLSYGRLLARLARLMPYSPSSSFTIENKNMNNNEKNNNGKSGKFIHQSWKTEQSVPTFYADARQSWHHMNPNHTVRFWNDTETDKFVHDAWPDYWHLYHTVFHERRILQSDLFRYLVVLKLGGVWADIDTKCLANVDAWNATVDIPTRVHKNGENSAMSDEIRGFVGVELDASDVPVDWFSVRLQFVQWTFAFTPGHPLLQHVVQRIRAKYGTMDPVSLRAFTVHDVTGPTIWTESILDYFEKSTTTSSSSSSSSSSLQQSDSLIWSPWTAVSRMMSRYRFRYLTRPEVMGDVAVMPVTAFSPDNIGMGGKSASHPDSLVQHLFFGSWKGRGG